MLWGRVYFGLQAGAGAVWWVGVALVPFVREATLGNLPPLPVAVLDIPLFVGASALAASGVRWAAWIATGWTVLVALSLAVYATVAADAGWGVIAMGAAAGASVLALALIVLGRVPTEWLLVGPFAARPARPGGRHGLMTAAQIVVLWGASLVVVPLVLAALERRWGLAVPAAPAVPVVGAALLVAATALGISTAVSMTRRGLGTPLPSATATRLVVTGPYRVVRNPMAIAGIAQAVAVGLVLGSWIVVVYALAGSLLWNYAIRPHEERDLEQRFGTPYRAYRDAVQCWVPRMPGNRI